MRIIKKLIQVLSITGSLVLYGCSSSESPPENNPESTGVITTPIVAGLRYATNTQDGVTDVTGTFKYLEGEVVKFYIGDVFVGESYARSVLTPLDLEQTASATRTLNTQKASSINDNWAINLFNLLLALDANGNASDGIEITAETISQITTVALQLELPPADFIVNTATIEFIVAINVTLSDPAEVSAFINMNYGNNSDWGTMVWGTSNWNNQ